MQESSIAAERIGRYQVLEPIGGGPNGAVWRAKVFGVAGFERQFAIKRFLPEITMSAQAAQALSAAARQYGGLEHPRIARMNEFGVAQGQTYTAVELVAGLDAMRMAAEAKLDGSALSTGGVLALISQAARAVGYAHGRGLAHLGLAPTNIMVTVEGDVKITDFGILAATMPPRPVEAPRLANRIPYLAPEQLAGDSTSAASDVFALGAIAYELVVGHRAHKGETPQQIAQAILAGGQPELPLPRPIVRVLQRCLARSPFERFPDARAFADALDAALRVAPVPGTRKDIGAQVKATLDRIAALNEGQMSGVLALHVGTGPVPRLPEAATLGRQSVETIDIATTEFARPDAPLPPQPATTFKDLPKPMTTVTGLAPPPIPVPPGLASQQPTTATPPTGVPVPNTMLGLSAARRAPPRIPNIGGRAATPLPPPPPPPVANGPRGLTSALDDLEVIDEERAETVDAAADEDSGRVATIPHLEAVVDDRAFEPPAPPAPANARDVSTDPGLGIVAARVTPTPQFSERGPIMTDEMSPQLAADMSSASTRPTSEVDSHVARAWRADPHAGFPDEAHVEHGHPNVEQMLSDMHADPAQQPPPAASQQIAPHAPPAPSAPKRWPIVLAAIVIVGGATAGVLLYLKSANETNSGGGDTKGSAVATKGSDAVATKGSDAVATKGSDTVVATKGSDTIVAPPPKVDAGTVAVATPPDAAPIVATAKVDAGAAPADAKAATAPIASSDSWSISSTPAGARVFVDGSDQGVTPVKLPGSPDKHTVVLFLAGHELDKHDAVEGHGILAPALKPVTPSGGPAGIKVIKCKDKDRYYVFVDGKPTGMTCPTERIEVPTGPHTVEVYDVQTEGTKKFDIVVNDTRLSYRVRLE